jgi:preprotein translocase subunit Sec63
MQNAHEVLGLPSTADEAEIRGRYLQLVREFPPDRAPERFAEIRAAFDELRNPIVQIERKLFSLQTNDSLDALQKDLRSRLKPATLSTAVLISLADAS